MSAPPGVARRNQQGAQASAGWGPNREIRRRAINAIGLINRVSFAQAREVYADTVHPFLCQMPRSEADAYLRTTYRIDPTGVTAVRNVQRERGF